MDNKLLKQQWTVKTILSSVDTRLSMLDYLKVESLVYIVRPVCRRYVGKQSSLQWDLDNITSLKWSPLRLQIMSWMISKIAIKKTEWNFSFYNVEQTKISQAMQNC